MLKRTEAPALNMIPDQTLQSEANVNQQRNEHRTPIFEFLYRMVQNAAVAEVLAIKAFARLDRGNRGGERVSLTGLFRIAADLALEEPRGRREIRQLPPADEPSGVGPAVASIPARQRAAMLMHKYHRMNSKQIASVLNCPEAVAQSLLLSAYDSLRRQLIRHEDCTVESA